jgi:hypothetical protein
VDGLNPQEELKRIEEQIDTATELAALRPAFYRLEHLIKTFPGDFDVQVIGADLKTRLIARGTLLKQQETSGPPVSPAVPETPVIFPAAPLATTPPEAGPPELPGTPEAAFPSSQVPISPAAPPPFKPAGSRALILVPVLLLIALIGVLLGVPKIRERIFQSHAAVAVDVTTAPAGASVKAAARQPKPGAKSGMSCVSNCKMALEPGTYQLTASLEGFEPAAAEVTVKGGKPASIRLALTPQAQSVRLLTDLERAKVVVDDRPPADLQDAQLVLEKLPAGSHTVTVTGPTGSASFSFAVTDGRPPEVTGAVNARNMIAVLVASAGSHARVVSNTGPLKLALNGQGQNDVSPAGVELTNFHPGVNEIVIGEGRDQRNMSENFSAAPSLTAFLKTDVNAGTLIVSTGQDDAHVFLNDKEYRRRTKRGEVRIPTLGKVTVRVAKAGFQDAPPQSVEVKKGAEVRLQFDLKPQPQFATLEIRGAMAGTRVSIDQKEAGTVGADGTLELSAIQPGDHVVELRHDQYQPKRLQRSFHAGQAVTVAGADAGLIAANGNLRILRNPATASITYRRGDEPEMHEMRGNQIELPPGSYAFTASAPGFNPFTARVQLAPGESKELEFTLAREQAAAPPPVTTSGMADFENAEGWKKEGDTWLRKGGGFAPYKLGPTGVFTFTVHLAKGKFRWCVQYIDAKTYLLYEIDRKEFWAGVVEKGKRYERVKTAHNMGNQKTFTIQVEVTPQSATQKLRVGSDWKVLDTFAEPGRDFTKGKFGFLVQGSDEIGISEFSFRPR